MTSTTCPPHPHPPVPLSDAQQAAVLDRARRYYRYARQSDTRRDEAQWNNALGGLRAVLGDLGWTLDDPPLGQESQPGAEQTMTLRPTP